MAHFFAHVRTDKGLVPDKEGFQLANVGKARESCSRIAKDLVGSNPSAINWTFELTDEMGRTVLVLPLRDCMPDQNRKAE